MSEKFRKQHIVPQAYLKRFAVKYGKNYVIGTRYISDNGGDVKLFNRAVSDVGYLNNYYDDLYKEDKKYWEHFFDKSFDVLYGKELGNIIASITLSMPNVKVLSDESKDILSKIIISQYLRVPAFLSYEIDNSKFLINSYKKEILKELPPNFPNDKKALIENIDFNSDIRKNMILDGMFSKKYFEKFCNVLKDKTWVAYYNCYRSSTPFVTSDNPVLCSNTKGEVMPIRSIGLANDETVIFYPLSPSILIAIYSPNIYFGELRKYDGLKLLLDEEKFIMKIDEKIISQSRTHSFIPEPLFTFLSKV